MTNKKLDILVVEDQVGPLNALSGAIRRVILGESGRLRYPRLYSESKQELIRGGIDVAQCYSEAQRAIIEKVYDLVFLDHRLPYENQGDLEETDGDAFSRTLENIGYSLIPHIRQRMPHARIIGTSSSHSDELRQFGNPDFRVDKISMTLNEDLAKILSEMETREDEGE